MQFSNHPTFVARLAAVVISALIHILAIYLTPEELRKLINRILRELLDTRGWKPTVIAAGLAGVFVLTFLTTFSISTYSIANYILDEHNSMSGLASVFKLIGVFLIIIASAFIFHYIEGPYQDSTERTAEFVDR